jgi:hypothetical protein
MAFVAGDAFDPNFIQPHPPFTQVPDEPIPDLNTLSNLTSLQGHVSIIHVSSLFHLFSEAEQLILAKQVASLLSPIPGSLILGCHASRKERGFRYTNQGEKAFCHSPESWAALWDGEVFQKRSVEVTAELRDQLSVQPHVGPDSEEASEIRWLWWSVRRV